MVRVLSALALSFALVACASSGRDDARDGLVDQLVSEGRISRSIAQCVVDGFFEDRSTDDLREFFERDELTDAEQAEFARLGEQCAG